LFVPEQIIIIITSIICAAQGHRLCLLYRHFWLRLSDCLGHTSSCGKEEKKDPIVYQVGERNSFSSWFSSSCTFPFGLMPRQFTSLGSWALIDSATYAQLIFSL
jgi:hypothetical protein